MIRVGSVSRGFRTRSTILKIKDFGLSINGADSSHIITAEADKILSFWLGEGYPRLPRNRLSPEHQKWFSANADLDKEMKREFSEELKALSYGSFDTWRTGFNGLAAVILMDQFPRFDAKALSLARHLLGLGATQHFVLSDKSLLLLPYMHSEHLRDQEAGVREFEKLVVECEDLEDADELSSYLKSCLKFARSHCDVIRQWGRFPHRNRILGRPNTPQEEEAFKGEAIPSF
eukprot:jgi/Botrbrau1/13993/Bobra.150_1s0005.2